MQTRRILISSPVYPDSFADNVAFTLRQMGHTVIAPPARSATGWVRRFRQVRTLLHERLSPGTTPAEERWLVNAARTHRPHLLLATTQSIARETLQTLKK